MKKGSFLLLVIVTGLALAGTIAVQFYWVRNAIELQERQFDKSVRLALKGTVNQLYECEHDSCYAQGLCHKHCQLDQAFVEGHIALGSLHKLIPEEFDQVNISPPYVYGIVNLKTLKLLYASEPGFDIQLIRSPHKASLSCVYKAETHMLTVWFPDERQRLLHRILWWLILSAFFLIVLVIGFVTSIYGHIQQKKITEMKSDFVNNVTHEFKTPIATLSLAGEMLQKPIVLSDPVKAAKYAAIIQDETQRLKTQVENVMQLTVLDNGSFVLKYGQHDLWLLLENTVNRFKVLVGNDGGDIRLEPYNGRHILEFDPIHIENVVVNLLDNAIKYTRGTPIVSVSMFERNNYAVVAVQDNGIGINSADKKNIFRKMYRSHTGNVHNVKGFGIGLYYVKTIVEAHHGSVDVVSEPGKGSRFEFTLPIYQTTSNKNRTKSE